MAQKQKQKTTRKKSKPDQPQLPGLEDQTPLTPEEEAELRHYDEAVEKLRGRFQGLTVTVGKAPQTRQWSSELKEQALGDMKVDEDSVSISSRLLDPKIPVVAKVNEIVAAIDRAKADPRLTLPFTRPGIRLVRVGDHCDSVQEMNDRLLKLREELQQAAADMALDMPHVREHMRHVLGASYDAKNYDYDPRNRYHLSWSFIDVSVPSYLRHNKKLYEQEEKRIQDEFREAVQIKEREMAEHLFRVVDKLASRLEQRQLFDMLHEVVLVERNEDSGEFRVTYRDERDSKKRKEVILKEQEFKLRVQTDQRARTFQRNTTDQVIEALEDAEFQMQENGIGSGQLQPVFDRLRETVKGHNKESLKDELRKNHDFREGMKTRLTEIGEKLLDLSVVKNRRTILRGRAESRALAMEQAAQL